jgi:hypothetical protein
VRVTGERRPDGPAFPWPVPLQEGKTVDALTLPNISQGTANNQTALRIFAIAVG